MARYSITAFLLVARSCVILMGSATNHETSVNHAIFTRSILVHAILSSEYHVKSGCPATFLRVMISLPIFTRRILFRYPNDQNTYNIDQQFLIGSAILVSPNLVFVNNLKEVETVFDQIRMFRILPWSMLTSHKMPGTIFHQVHNWKRWGNSLLWLHLFRRLMCMFAVVPSFQCRYQVQILPLDVEIHLNY